MVAYATVIGLLGYKLHSVVMPEEKAIEETTSRPASAGDYQALLKDKAAEKFREEQERSGLMLMSAFYGERTALEAYLQARRGAPAPEDLEATQDLRDVSVPLRFWVNHSRLHFPAGPKPYLHRGSARPLAPALLIMYSLLTRYRLGSDPRTHEAFFDEADEIALGVSDLSRIN